MKLVINACYGGFNLSDKAFIEWARRKNYAIVKYNDEIGFLWAIEKLPFSENFIPYKEVQFTLEFISARDIPRDDPILIELIETLGSNIVSGPHSSLKIVEIPDDVKWQIEEYDGMESISEIHRTWS